MFDNDAADTAAYIVVVELRNGTSYGHQWMELIIDARYLDLVIVECCAANINKIGFGML
ncbi:hypothetical protein [Alistipes putredinis]|uniref:hypothetical protein n=1 Tax=Alistipes putredinis TaxID=28117 RepID=UPI0026659055|nr:hypothetical protein [Alistipes putredinis]